MLRGGSWNNNQNNARAAYRNNNHPNNRNNNAGCRVVRRPTSQTVPPSIGYSDLAPDTGRMTPPGGMRFQ
ncbi:MAG: hypothetical protein KIS95_01170 [Anaerolineae bacterium]|uniref:hypothetical protein n=1 Tax=Promineifilum sp. TaxID=2664178 RepID=UPI0031CC8070|nr:hypothetical protein [Anaerolineae bacterium]